MKSFFKSLLLLYCLLPYPRGMIAALVDIARGHSEIHSIGLRRGEGAIYDRLLWQKYGVVVKDHGCVDRGGVGRLRCRL